MFVAPHSITWRMATQDELERCQVQDKANLIDGASAVLVQGELVGICDEYGTAVYVADRFGDELIERFNEVAGAIAAIGVRG